MLKRWVKEPLVHFLGLGAVLFVVYAWVHPATSPRNRIEISRAEIDQLSETFTRQWMRTPRPEELKALVDDAIRVEIFAREAVALGLDRDDVVLRRRLAQKYEFLSRDLLRTAPPTDTELVSYMADHRDRYEIPERIWLEQIYFGSEHRKAPQADARAVLTKLLRGGAAGKNPGDVLLVPRELQDKSPSELGALLGPEFVRAVASLQSGSWAGPIRSSYGWHLVRVERRLPAALPSLAEVRDDVERDWREEELQQASDRLYAKLRSHYQVVVVPTPSESGEVASTGEASKSAL